MDQMVGVGGQPLPPRNSLQGHASAASVVPTPQATAKTTSAAAAKAVGRETCGEHLEAF